MQDLIRKLDDIKKKPDFLHKTHTYLENTKEIFAGWIEGVGEDLSSSSTEIAQEYVEMSKIFWEIGKAPNAAINLLFHGSDQFSAWQYEKKQYISRSTLFGQLTAYYLHIFRDIGSATWWALHMVTDSQGGNNTFISRLGYPQEVARELQGQRSTSGNDRFTEDIISNFFITNPQYHYILGQNSESTAFPLCKAYFNMLFNELEKHSGKNEKGEALERLAYYLFLLMPGCIPRKNVRDADNTHETDLVVLNRHPTSNLAVELFGRHIAVECKNWKHSVGVPDVGYFLHKLHLMHASFGVLFAQNGITGTGKDRDELAARQLIRRTFHEDNILCIVITNDHLLRLQEGSINFPNLLMELADDFRFGK